MSVELPRVLREALTEGAARLGRALEVLDWPNGGKNAPCHEVNAVLNVSYCLSKATPQFHLYAEGTVASRGRIDLVGFNGEIALALEAKNFGAINRQGDSLLADFRRLETFVPALSEVANNYEAQRWWQDAKERWGIIVVSSYRGGDVKNAWLANDESEFRRHMSAYAKHEQPQEVDGVASGFLALYRATQDALRGAEPITTGQRWKDTGEGWMLWAAIPLPTGPAA